MVIKIGTFGNDLLLGSNGADSLIGSFGNDLLRGLGGNDSLSGGGDNDTLEGGAGNDSLFGDGGVDTMLFDTNTSVTVSAQNGVVISAGLGTDTFQSVENVTTGSGADNIFFDAQNNVISTGGGADTVFASGGNDTVDGGDQGDSLSGENGTDALYGGNGNDTLNGGAGNDVIDGGSGTDTVVFDTTAHVSFDQTAQEAQSTLTGIDVVINIENVTTGAGEDYIWFDDSLTQANVVNSGSGDDIVATWAGNDTLNLGAGADHGYGGAGNDILNGGSQDDDLEGDAGLDTLNGGSGHDDLSGGAGVDALSGGTGSDEFFFDDGESGVGDGNRDVVVDFSQAQGDELNLWSIAGELEFIGEDGFSAPNQVRFFHEAGNTIVGINTSGNSGAEMQIELVGEINLVAGDFFL